MGNDTLIVYKALTDDGLAPEIRSYRWLLPEGDKPGPWVEVDTKVKKIGICVWGLHGWLTRAIAEKNYAPSSHSIFEMELEGNPILKNTDKAVGHRARLLRQLSGRRTFTLGEVADAVAKNGSKTEALAVAAKNLGVAAGDLTRVLPTDLYVVDEAGDLVTVATYLRQPKLGDRFVRRVWALSAIPLKVEFRVA